jgi:tRNA pseudouridine55 synthase
MGLFSLTNKKVSSNQLVQEIKKKIKAKKVGHTGTLDPLASGLLFWQLIEQLNFQVTS